MHRLPPLRLLTTFADIVEAGSMRAAAARLNVTQPAVTQALKALEDHVGVALLDRSTRPARLTEAGRQLAQATREGLGMIAATVDDLRQRYKEAHPHLTVACSLGMATYWLLPRLPDFYAHHPGIFVNVQAPPTDTPRFLPGVDVVLRYGRGLEADTRTAKLFDEQICPVGRPALVARLLENNTPLHEAPLIHVDHPATDRWEDWIDYLRAIGGKRPHKPGEVFDNYVHAVQAALNGRGLMLGWRSITAQLVAEGALVPWPDGVLNPGTSYFAIRANDRTSTPASAFFTWLHLAAQQDVSMDGPGARPFAADAARA